MADISLSEAREAARRKGTLNKCGACNGSGKSEERNWLGFRKDCPICYGDGETWQTEDEEFNDFQANF